MHTNDKINKWDSNCPSNKNKDRITKAFKKFLLSEALLPIN